MDARRLGDSDVMVTPVTLGTWAIGGWMWGGTDERQAVDAIRAALDAGVTSIDTAAIYGFGLSEELVGRAIAGRRDEVQILTKYGLRWDSDEGTEYFETTDRDGRRREVRKNARPDSVVYECEQSLRRLGTDCIDLYQCHWRDVSTPVADTMEAVAKLLEQGKIRAAGVSNFSVEEIEAARKVVPIASDQPPYSMLLRDAENDILPYCREHNIGVIVYSPLQRGLLTGKITEDYQFGPGDHRAGSKLFQPENVRRVNAFLDDIRPIAEAHDATLGQLVIHWTLRRPGVTAALVGARNPKQATENAKAAELEISDDELRQIDERLEGLELSR